MPRKPKAKLYLRFRTPDGKQSPYCPALFDHKSRICPFWCLVKGVEELHYLFSISVTVKELSP